MSDYDFPELPSDEELGITDEDREKYGEELPDDRPEMSDEELAALLGEVPSRVDPGKEGSKKSGGSGTKASEPTRKERREAKKREMARKKEEARKKKELSKAARRAAKEQAKEAGASAAATAPSGGASGAGGAGGATDRAGASGTGDPGAGTAGDRSGGGSGDGSSGDGGGAPGDGGGRSEAAAGSGAVRRWRGAATLVLLTLVGLVASTRTGLPDPVPASAPDTAFSSSRAMSTLVEIASEPHPTGSPEHARVRSLLVDRLESLGLQTEVQTTTSLVRFGDRVRSATVRNVIGRIPGSDPTGTVLITAHYDSRQGAPGAADDGSGVVSIIEAVRAMLADRAPTNDVVVLLTDGEELGLLGARAFVEQHPTMASVDLVLSFEMRGAGGPSIMFETNDDNGWVVRALDAFDEHPSANSLSQEVYRRMPNDTDFTPFREAGVQGMNFATIDRANIYHQSYDTPDHLSEGTLQHHGLHALRALEHFAHADLTTVDAGDVVYFSVPGLGLVVYDDLWVLPLSGALLLGFGLLVWLALRGGMRPGAAAAGFAVFVVSAAATWGVAYAGLRWLPAFHEETGSLYVSLFHSEGWYVLALVASALTFVTGLSAIALRWITRPELAIGSLVVPLVGAVVLSVAAPLGAMNLQWPVLAAIVAAGLVALLRDRADGWVGWVAVTALAVPIVLLLVPLVELLWIALTLRVAGPLGVLIVMGLFLVRPALDGLRRPNAWWAPVGGALATLAFVGIGLLHAGADADRPDPTTLAYAYEHGSGAAVWATDPTSVDGDDEGRAWARAATSANFDEERDLTDFDYLSGSVPVAPAPIVDAAQPSIRVVSDSVRFDERRVVLAVRSVIGAERLVFQLDEGVRLLEINDHAVDDPATVRGADHWGVPVEAVRLRLSLPPEAPIGIHVVEHLLRPAELLGAGPFSRPPHLAPDVNRLSDRAMLRYSVGVFGESTDDGTVQGDVGFPVDSVTIRSDTLDLNPDSAGPALPPDTAGTANGAPPATSTDSTNVPLDTTGPPGATPDSTGSTGAARDTTGTPVAGPPMSSAGPAVGPRS